jgi:hypothetical protein
MSHFAQIDENNVVQQVLVIEQDEINSYRWGDPETWIQTSYNTRGGIYYTPDTHTPDPDQSKSLRKNYAGIGFLWLLDGPSGPGFAPPSPYPSWVMDSFSYLWSAPVPMPTLNGTGYYDWNEATLSWVFVPATDTTLPGSAPNVIG